MTAITLAHFSDPHLAYEPQLSLLQRFSKRQLSALSWARGRRKSQQHDLLERLVADVRAHAPDHWAITGDIGNFSLPGEFPLAANWLRSLAPARQVSVVPGNHDALVALEHARGWGLWQPWMSNDDGSESWPYVRERGDIALIGVSSALPTLPLLASGRVGQAQLQRLEQQLRDLGARGLCRVLMIHHPVAAGAISYRKALRDADALREVIGRAGVELLLHGHARGARLDALAGPAGVVPVLGLPSASAVPSARDAGARWQWLRIARRDDGAGWALEQRVRVWDAAARAFVGAGRYHFRLLKPLPAQHAG